MVLSENIARINEITKNAFAEVYAKLSKDYGLMDDLPISDNVELCWTNRRIVSIIKLYVFIFNVLI